MEEGCNHGNGAYPNMQYPPYQQLDPSTMHPPPYAYGDNDSDFAKRQRMYMSPPSYSNDGSAMDVAPNGTMVDADLDAWARRAQGGDLAMMFRFSPSPGAPDNGQPVDISPTDAIVHRPAVEQPNMSIYTSIMMTGDKPNSTSSIFCRDTVLNPNADQIILCMSSVLHVQMLQDEGAGAELKQRFSVFNDPVDTSMGATIPELGAPLQVTAEEIHKFIERMFKWAQFSTECNIIALVYINRIIALTNLPLHQGNWKAVVLVALMIAQKVWDDRGLSLSGFSVVCPEFGKERLKAMEMKFLEMMQYRAVVTQGLYARYYFELRALFEQLLRQSHSTRSFPLKPLRLWEARKLELVSDAFGLNRHPNAANRSQRLSGSPPLPPGFAPGGACAGEGGSSTMDYTSLATVPEETNYPGSGLMSCASSVRSDRSINFGNRVRQPTGLHLPPQSPGMTYEDLTVTSKGRFVQS